MISQQSPPTVPTGAFWRKERWQAAAVCVALAAMTFAVFGQTLGHQFIAFDDSGYVYDNPMVSRGLTLKGMAWALTGAHADNWFPLTWISHMLDCQLYGLRPAGHHLTNVLLHTATVIALFLVLRQMTGALWRSAFVAAVFAIHPLRVESVAWVAERKDVLCGLFFMLTIAAYARYARRPWSLPRYSLVLCLFALGLMCKPMLVTLPLVLLLLDYWPLRRMECGTLGKLALEKLPLLALSAVSCIATLLHQREAIQTTAALPMSLRLGNALAACAIYLGQMVWPAKLAVLYPFRRLEPWKLELAALILTGISAAALWQWRRRPWLLAGWLWYLIMLLPVMGIIQAGAQPHADRYTYLPHIGIYVAATWLMAEWGAKQQAAGLAFAALGAAAMLMVCAWKQAAYWKDGETLWTHTLACATGDDTVPKNPPDQADGLCLAVIHYNLGKAFAQKGRWDDAIAQFQEALQTRPDNAATHCDLGIVLRQAGRLDEAIDQLRRALQLKPGFVLAHNALGNAFLEKGAAAQAMAQFERAAQLAPDDPWSKNNLAWLLASCPDPSLRNGARALALAGQASDLAGGENPAILHTLAAALAEAGRCSDAVATAQRALRLAEAQSKHSLAGQLQSEIQLYQAGRPFHMPAQNH